MFAPLETMNKANSKLTVVPKGKTNKEFVYSLDNFIIVPNQLFDDQESTLDEGSRDEYFSSLFTLSRFRKDMMLLAMEKFPEEYAIEK